VARAARADQVCDVRVTKRLRIVVGRPAFGHMEPTRLRWSGWVYRSDAVFRMSPPTPKEPQVVLVPLLDKAFDVGM